MSVITERVGDIFASPRGSILIHACNAKGFWGAGVALDFKKRYPTAYKIYREYCNRPQWLKSKTIITGTALLISPNEHVCPRLAYDGFHIACLFTSENYGKNVDSPQAILANTAKALGDLDYHIQEARQDEKKYAESNAEDKPVWEPIGSHVLRIEERQEREEIARIEESKPAKRRFLKNGTPVGRCRAVRINSGRFGVPWEQTKKMLEDGPLDIVVVRPRTDSKMPGENEEGENSEDSGGNESESESGDGDESGDEQEPATTDDKGEKEPENPHTFSGFQDPEKSTRSSARLSQTRRQSQSQSSQKQPAALAKAQPATGTKRKLGDTKKGTYNSPSPTRHAAQRKRRA